MFRNFFFVPSGSNSTQQTQSVFHSGLLSIVACFALLLIPCTVQGQTLIPLNLSAEARAEAPLFEDSEGDRYSRLVRVKFGEHVFDTTVGQVTVSLSNVRAGYSAVTALFNQLEADYSKFTLKKAAPSIVWGDTLRLNKRTGNMVSIADYSQLIEVWFDDPVPLADVISDFEQLQEVAYAERPQVTVPLSDIGGCVVPNTPNFPALTAPPNDPQYENGRQYSLPKIEAAKAWDITRGTDFTQQVGIAVLDGFGEDRELVDIHDDLDGKLTVLDAFTQGTRHAAAVSGLAGAHTDNNSFVASLGWEVDLFGFRRNTLGLLALLEELDNPASPAYGKVDVINMSSIFLSDPYEDNNPIPGDQSLSGLVRSFLNMGIVVVAGAGNGSCGGNAGCGRPPCSQFPAALSYDDLEGENGTTFEGQVLAATLTDWNDEFFEELDYSPGADPLADPEAAYIDVAAPGLNVRILRSFLVNGSWNHGLADCLASPGTCSGTSYSSPIVAALAALVFSINPTLRVDEVYDIITRSAEKVDQNERPDTFFYVDPVTGDSLSWNQYTGYGRVNAYRALVRTLEQHGGTLAQDVVVPAGETWNLGDKTLAFAPGTRLIVEGTLNADGTTFTERNDGQGWGGILVAGDATLDGATVEYAATGITVYDPATATIATSTLRFNGTGLDIRSAGGTVVSASTVEQNTTGVEAGIIDCYGISCPCLTSCRGDLDLLDSSVENNTGYGIIATDATARIERTFVRDNGAGGLFASNARVDAYPENCIEANGSGNGLGGFGVTVLPGGDLYLSEFITPGLTRIAGNEATELFISNGGYTLVGDNSGSGGDNAIFDTGGGLLIYNGNNTGGKKDDVEAFYTWWGSSSGPSGSDFSPLGSVDFLPYLSSDPTASVCASGSRPANVVLHTSASEGTANDEAGRGEREALRAAILVARAALRANPAADSAAGLVGRLRSLHKQDRADDLREHAATFGLLRSLRARLNTPNLPAGMRATAEAALMAEALDMLSAEGYEEAVTLLDEWASYVESAQVLQVLRMVEVHVAASAGNYASAAALVETVAAEADEAEAEALSTLVALYTGRAEDAAAREGGPAARGGAPGNAAARSVGSGAVAGPTLAAYPNPFEHTATVALALGEHSTVSLVVYDVLGRRVAVLADGEVVAGVHSFDLDAARLPSGLYLVRAEVRSSGGEVQALTTRLTHIK